MTVYKKFDKQLYDIYDPAKYLIIDFFKKQGVKIDVHKNQYEVDLVVEGKCYIEVQVKNHFTGPVPQFRDPWLHIEPRKEKYLYKDLPTIFCVLNKEKTHAIFVNSHIVKKCQKKEVSNCKVFEGEYFYIVPLEKTKVLKIV